jgi:hypothetical protein
MLAGTLFDGERLVPPRWASAGIHPARVLDFVGLLAGALHLDGFAIFQIGHEGILRWFSVFSFRFSVLEMWRVARP